MMGFVGKRRSNLNSFDPEIKSPISIVNLTVIMTWAECKMKLCKVRKKIKIFMNQCKV